MIITEMLLTSKGLHLEVIKQINQDSYQVDFNGVNIIVTKGENGELFNADNYLGLVVKQYNIIQHE